MDRVYSDFNSNTSYSDHQGTILEHAGKDRIRTASIPVSSSSNELLRSLPADLFQKLSPSLRSVYLEAEQFLYFQDDKLDYVYFP